MFYEESFFIAAFLACFPFHFLKQRKFLRIQDFSVKHTTLDEVFVGFAKSEEENGIKKDVKRLSEKRMSFEKKSELSYI